MLIFAFLFYLIMLYCVRFSRRNETPDVFLVLNLFYSFTEGGQIFYFKKKILRGGPKFVQGGVPAFFLGGGGVNMLIYIEISKLVIFQGGGEVWMPYQCMLPSVLKH